VWPNLVKSHLAIDFVKSHPVIAIIIFGTYGILLAVWFFAGKIFGKVLNRLLEWIADYIDRWSRQRFTRFEMRYREFMLSNLRWRLRGAARWPGRGGSAGRPQARR
jgi:hypothetical protein